MFESLHKLLRVDSEPLENVEFMHISGEASGAGLANYSFLLHHFLSYFIKNSFRVSKWGIGFIWQLSNF